MFWKSSTDLPLGETEVHLAAALSVEAGAFLERPAHGAGGDGQVAVVAIDVVSNFQCRQDCS